MSAPNPSARKLAARRWNEHLKLIATSLNTIALGIVGAAYVIPGVAGTFSMDLPRLIWLFYALVLHLASHAVLRFFRSED
jgi:hypothetical protein